MNVAGQSALAIAISLARRDGAGIGPELTLVVQHEPPLPETFPTDALACWCITAQLGVRQRIPIPADALPKPLWCKSKRVMGSQYGAWGGGGAHHANMVVASVPMPMC